MLAILEIPENPYSLRRAVLHPSLVLSTSDDENEKYSKTDDIVSVGDLMKHFTNGKQSNEEIPNLFVEKVLSDLANDDCAECPVCLDAMQVPVLLPGCLHQWYGAS